MTEMDGEAVFYSSAVHTSGTKLIFSRHRRDGALTELCQG